MKRILKNTVSLYIRQILILFVSLYSTRVVLHVLGIESFGMYSVVTGVVTLCIFLPGTMASATQRYFSYALGQNDRKTLEKIFSVNVALYFMISGVALMLLETLGLWFIKYRLNIPIDAVHSVTLLYHYSVCGFILNVMTAPFISIIIAHEEMKIYAYASISEAVMKLAAAYLLMEIDYNKLELYGALLLFVAIINAVTYIVVCINRYPECQFRKIYWDSKLFKEILNFTGWTLFGQSTSVLRNQAVTVLLNQMFSPAVVAARAIALSVSGQVNLFSNNFNTGLYPPIIKSYAANNRSEMLSLIFGGSKITFFLMWIFALPLILEMDVVLRLWLQSPPIEAIYFSQLALIESLIVSLSLPITTAARAPGKMKLYELTLGIIQLAIFPISWLVLTSGYDPSAVFLVAIGANIFMFITRLVIVEKSIGLPMLLFIKSVVFPVIAMIILTTSICLLIKKIMIEGDELLYAGVMTGLSFMLNLICFYTIGLDKQWRAKIKILIKHKIKNSK